MNERNVAVCVKDSLLPLSYTIAYFSLNIIGAVTVLVKTYSSPEIRYSDKSFGNKLIDAIKSVKTKRSCYFPFLTHIFDQSTDIGVIVEFYLLYQYEENYKSRHNGIDPCEEVNGFYLFILSLGSLLAYRIISSILVALRTQSKTRAFLQFWDILLFHALYINYKTKSNQPSNPQKWLQMLEALFESFPQSLIQLFYIIKTNQLTQFNSLVIVSLIFSFLSLCNKVVSDDAPSYEQDKGKQFVYYVHHDNDNDGDSNGNDNDNYKQDDEDVDIIYDIQSMDVISDDIETKIDILMEKQQTQQQLQATKTIQKSHKHRMFSPYYVARVLYRVLDALYRLLILVLIWIIMGGIALFFVLFVEFTILVIASWQLEELSALCDHDHEWSGFNLECFGLLNLIVLSPMTRKFYSGLFVYICFLYRFISNVIWMIALFIISATIKPENDIANIKSMPPELASMLIFASITTFIIPGYWLYLVFYVADLDNSSVDRNYEMFLKNGDFQSALELYEFGFSVSVSNDEFLYQDIISTDVDKGISKCIEIIDNWIQLFALKQLWKMFDYICRNCHRYNDWKDLSIQERSHIIFRLFKRLINLDSIKKKKNTKKIDSEIFDYVFALTDDNLTIAFIACPTIEMTKYVCQGKRALLQHDQDQSQQELQSSKVEMVIDVDTSWINEKIILSSKLVTLDVLLYMYTQNCNVFLLHQAWILLMQMYKYNREELDDQSFDLKLQMDNLLTRFSNNKDKFMNVVSLNDIISIVNWHNTSDLQEFVIKHEFLTCICPFLSDPDKIAQFMIKHPTSNMVMNLNAVLQSLKLDEKSLILASINSPVWMNDSNIDKAKILFDCCVKGYVLTTEQAWSLYAIISQDFDKSDVISKETDIDNFYQIQEKHKHQPERFLTLLTKHENMIQDYIPNPRLHLNNLIEICNQDIQVLDIFKICSLTHADHEIMDELIDNDHCSYTFEACKRILEECYRNTSWGRYDYSLFDDQRTNLTANQQWKLFCKILRLLKNQIRTLDVKLNSTFKLMLDIWDFDNVVTKVMIKKHSQLIFWFVESCINQMKSKEWHFHWTQMDRTKFSQICDKIVSVFEQDENVSTTRDKAVQLALLSKDNQTLE